MVAANADAAVGLGRLQLPQLLVRLATVSAEDTPDVDDCGAGVAGPPLRLPRRVQLDGTQRRERGQLHRKRRLLLNLQLQQPLPQRVSNAATNLISTSTAAFRGRLSIFKLHADKRLESLSTATTRIIGRLHLSQWNAPNQLPLDVNDSTGSRGARGLLYTSTVEHVDNYRRKSTHRVNVERVERKSQ